MTESWHEYLDLGPNDLPEDVAFTAGESPPPQTEPTDLDELADLLLLDDSGWLHDLIDLLEERKQLVLYGPPGTGKTFVARRIAEFFSGAEEAFEVVQFHPSFSYENFVEGYRPIVLSDGRMVYELRPGPLIDFARRATVNPNRRFVLLIDEINRGNLPKIFGELLYLLEYRDESVRLLYRSSDETFRLPRNLYFVGTMNTTDRSIGIIDAALRRRFHFLGLFPNQTPIMSTLEKWIAMYAPDLAWLPKVVNRLNDHLAALDDQLQVGHSYFMRPGINEHLLELVWKADVLPYLEDQLFGRQDVDVTTFRLERLRQELQGQPAPSPSPAAAPPTDPAALAAGSETVDEGDPVPTLEGEPIVDQDADESVSDADDPTQGA